MTQDQKKVLTAMQRAELTEYRIYSNLAAIEKNERNKEILSMIALEEKGHYERLEKFTGARPPGRPALVFIFTLLARLFGLQFTLRLMENGEGRAINKYSGLVELDPIFQKIEREEEQHEKKLLGMIDEEKLHYVGSFVLGLNDAIVEITGTVAGLTIVLSNTRLIGVVALIGGFSAAMSMAGSEYLATKEKGNSNPKMSAIVTGVAYMLTVFLLVIPYFILANHFFALALTVGLAILVIAAFNFYISVAREVPFRRRFGEMIMISLGVTVVSFLVGYGLSIIAGLSAIN